MAKDSLSLYDITAEERRFIEALVEGEGELTPELEEAMDTMKENKVCKVQDYHNLYVHLQAVADAARQEEDRLARKRKTAEAGMRRLKDGLLYNMESLGLRRIEGETVEVRIKANPGRIVFDEGAVLRDSMRYVEAVRKYLPEWVSVKVEVSRSKLKEAFQRGGQPFDESVRIEESNTVIFK